MNNTKMLEGALRDLRGFTLALVALIEHMRRGRPLREGDTIDDEGLVRILDRVDAALNHSKHDGN